VAQYELVREPDKSGATEPRGELLNLSQQKIYTEAELDVEEQPRFVVRLLSKLAALSFQQTF
jgi:hypothetical protein